MDVALYISDLLRTHNEISVSGLGTFFKNRREGYFDQQKGVFLPPAAQLEYRSVYSPDARLAEYISAEKHISIGSSEHFIERFAENIHNQLRTEQTAEVPPLGIFYRTAEGYSFIPAESQRFDKLSYGLSPVKEIQKETPAPPPRPPVTPGDNPREHEPFNEDNETGDRRRIPVIAIILCILVAAGIALYFFSPDIIRRFTGSAGKARVNQPVNQIVQADPLADTTAADTLQQLHDTAGITALSDTLKPSVQADTVSISYEIIVASLNSRQDAEQMVSRFKSKGITARIILAKDKKKNNILISLASLINRQDASEELNRVRNNIEPGAYIYNYKK